MTELNNAIQYLKSKYNLTNGFFCIYGSYATSTQNKNSDIDLLYIHRTNVSKLNRTNEIFNNVSISFYELSIKDLYDDSIGKYGGFFCGKIFNPNLFFDNTKEDDLIIQKSVATFFSNLISEKHCNINKKYSSDEILKNNICAYIDLYPEYISYIIRLIKSDKNASIWNKWKKVFIDMLLNENIIQGNGEGYIYKCVFSTRHFESIKVDYISRFWIYGAISHNSNINFYDYYKNKNKDYILKNIKYKEKTEKFLGISYVL